MLREGRLLIRSLVAGRKLVAAAILTFALGVGPCIALVALFDRLFLRPLPFPQAQELVQIHLFVNADPRLPQGFLPVSYVEALASRRDVFSGIAWVNGGAKDQTRPALGENPLTFSAVTENALDVLRLKPAWGRAFDVSDVANGAVRSVLLTYQTWVARYRSSSEVTSLYWRDGPFTYRVIGVLPKDFLLPSSRLLEQFDGIYAYRHTNPHGLRGALISAPFGRLQPGVSISQARTVASSMLAGLAWEALDGPGAPERRTVQIEPLLSLMSLLVREPMRLVFSAASVVFLVAAVNLALLLSVWARTRERAVGIQLCLGAPRSRLARNALLEALAICLCGTALGWLSYSLTQAALTSTVPSALQSFAVGPTDLRLIVASLIATLAGALACSIPPIRAAYAADVLTVLDRQRASRSGLSALRPLLAFEAALGLLLAIAAATAVPEFIRLQLQSPGYRPSDLYVVDVGHDWPDNAVKSERNSARKVSTILDALRQVAGVDSVAASLATPLGVLPVSDEFWLSRGQSGGVAAISAGYFEVLELPIIAGRSFSDEEIGSKALLAVVDEAASRALWSVDPREVIGRELRTADGIRVVLGVVANLRPHPGAPSSPNLYIPITANEARSTQSALPVVVRMARGRDPDVRALRAALDARFPRDSVRVQSVEESFRGWTETPRLLAVILGTFGGISLVLVAIAMTALVRFDVDRRTHEIAIRLALGASLRQVRWTLTRSFVIQLLLGLAVGGVLTAWMSGLAENWLGINTRTPDAYLLATALTLAVAIIAALAPTIRLSRANLSQLLRR